MHASTYEYLKPTDDQVKRMAELRRAARVYGEALEREKHETNIRKERRSDARGL